MSSTVSTVRPTVFSHLPSPAHPTGWEHPRQLHHRRLGLKKVQEASLADEAARITGGLRTPPAEGNMSTAYQNHAAFPSTYDNHVSLIRQPSTLVQASRAGGVLCDAGLPQISRNQPPPHQQSQSQPQPYQHQQYQSHQAHHGSNSNTITNNTNQLHSASSGHSTRPSTPSSTSTHSEGTVSRRDSTMVMHSLQLPSCISPNGGNLDDFAALMTCFFWFENMETIHAAEKIKNRPANSAVLPLSKHTQPCSAYKKWVNSILSTTQVTQNVILLALLFVYRLKSTNPKVNGSPGSEYRLLTVALMLGNKFLDDNTYTNKTWAEVSGIPVKEIHVMEVEFLSNMRYGLLTSRDQWQEWLKKLACFHEYCEKAEAAERAAEMAAAARRQRAPIMPINLPSPTTQGRFSSPLPSPTNILPSNNQGTPSSLAAYSPNSNVYNSNHNWSGTYQPAPALSPLASKPNLILPGTRKRSLEGSEVVEPAPKRVSRQAPVSLPPSRPLPHATEPARLPLPQLTVDTSQSTTTPVYPPSSSYSQAPVSLPPLGAGVRAMSTVYPPTSSWTAQVSIVATSGPQTTSYTAPANYGTPTKRHSPGSLSVYSSSPLTELRTPVSNSPSVYLQQRNSPYKPVRPVNTLNYPPPSIPLSEYHLGSTQMHYQSLGRRHVRSGIVPEFVHSFGGVRPTPVPTAQAQGQHYHH